MNYHSNQRPLLVYRYEHYLTDQDIASYIRSISRCYTVGSLERVAAMGDRTARRGAVLALGRLADYRSNSVLGRALVDSDRGVRTLAENSISPTLDAHWYAEPTAEPFGPLLSTWRIKNTTVLHRYRPGWWTMLHGLRRAGISRGKAFFHMEQYDAATRDCHQSLEINPYHFLAASVMGQAYQSMGNRVSALESFRRALRLNPSMEDVRAQVIHIQRTLKGE